MARDLSIRAKSQWIQNPIAIDRRIRSSTIGDQHPVPCESSSASVPNVSQCFPEQFSIREIVRRPHPATEYRTLGQSKTDNRRYKVPPQKPELNFCYALYGACPVWHTGRAPYGSPPISNRAPSRSRRFLIFTAVLDARALYDNP